MHLSDIIEGPHEAGLLSLETFKARVKLGFESRLTLSEAIQMTIDWYKSQLQGADARQLCEEDISNYEALV